MCRQVNLLQDDVRATVQAKLDAGESFTAYDITKAMPATVSHRYVKPIVHELFESGEMAGYDRRIDTSIVGFPYEYFKIPVAAPQPAVSTNSAPVQQKNVVRILKHDLNKYGFKAGDRVKAIYLTPANEIRVWDPTVCPPPVDTTTAISTIEVRNLTIDSKTNLRMTVPKPVTGKYSVGFSTPGQLIIRLS